MSKENKSYKDRVVIFNFVSNECFYYSCFPLNAHLSGCKEQSVFKALLKLICKTVFIFNEFF